MSDEDSRIEQRIHNMKRLYLKVAELIEQLPEAIPEKTKTMLQDAILGDKDLKSFMNGLDAHRPPRIFLIGRTGVGKSSLINALCGSYVARVSDTRSCTNAAECYECLDGNRVLMEILDTRGIAESEALDETITAEEAIIKQVDEFSPDVAIFMLNCTHKDDVGSDVEFLKRVANSYQESNGIKLPIVVVVNKCDQMQPAREKDPAAYSENKKRKIEEQVQYYKSIIAKNKLKVEEIIGVSSYIEWQTPDGMYIDVEDIDGLPEKDIKNLQIYFDGRYQIDELFDVLLGAIHDLGAQMGLRMAARLTDVGKRLSKHLCNIFTGIASAVALTPVPVSDIYILLTLQAVLVCLIASLSGRELSLGSAKDFILGTAGAVGTGYTFRLLAQQSSKLLNTVFPGAGSAVSSGIAALGTQAIGNAAISFYIDGINLDSLRKEFEKRRSEAKPNTQP